MRFTLLNIRLFDHLKQRLAGFDFWVEYAEWSSGRHETSNELR